MIELKPPASDDREKNLSLITGRLSITALWKSSATGTIILKRIEV